MTPSPLDTKRCPICANGRYMTGISVVHRRLGDRRAARDAFADAGASHSLALNLLRS